MGAAEPLQSVLWVKQERCAVSLEPARALLRWWRSPVTGPCAPDASECDGPGLVGPGAASTLGLRFGQAGVGGTPEGGGDSGHRERRPGHPRRRGSEVQGPGAGRSQNFAAAGGEPSQRGGPRHSRNWDDKASGGAGGGGEGRASAAPEHPRDPRGGLLLLRHTWTGLVLVTPFLQYSEPKYRHMLLYRRRPEVPWRDFLCLGS